MGNALLKSNHIVFDSYTYEEFYKIIDQRFQTQKKDLNIYNKLIK